jgi:hypothetical protein
MGEREREKEKERESEKKKKKREREREGNINQSIQQIKFTHIIPDFHISSTLLDQVSHNIQMSIG